MLHKSDNEAPPPTDFGDALAPGDASPGVVALPERKMLCVEAATPADTEAPSVFQGVDRAAGQSLGKKISGQKSVRPKR
jgi:hypothetical protein